MTTTSILRRNVPEIFLCQDDQKSVYWAFQPVSPGTRATQYKEKKQATRITHEQEGQCRSRKRERVRAVQDDEAVKALIVPLDVGRDPDPVARLDLARIDQLLVLVDGAARGASPVSTEPDAGPYSGSRDRANVLSDSFPLRKARSQERVQEDRSGRGLDSHRVRVVFGGEDPHRGRRGPALALGGGPRVERADGGAVGEDGLAGGVVEPAERWG